jgi:hypothetical protein
MGVVGTIAGAWSRQKAQSEVVLKFEGDCLCRCRGTAVVNDCVVVCLSKNMQQMARRP